MAWDFPLDRQGRNTGIYPFIKVSDMTLEGNETYIRLANNYVDAQDVEDLGANVSPCGYYCLSKGRGGDSYKQEKGADYSYRHRQHYGGHYDLEW